MDDCHQDVQVEPEGAMAWLFGGEDGGLHGNPLSAEERTVTVKKGEEVEEEEEERKGGSAPYSRNLKLGEDKDGD